MLLKDPTRLFAQAEAAYWSDTSSTKTLPCEYQPCTKIVMLVCVELVVNVTLNWV